MKNKKSEKSDLTAKEKIEQLAQELEKDPKTQELAVVLYVIAGSTLLGKEAQKSLALWTATWADSVINEVEKMREEEKTQELASKIILPNENE